MTVCVAEGCTGGDLLSNLTVPGSVRAFHIGIIAYSLPSKLDLGVSQKIIDNFGEYSQEVVIAMAEAIRKKRNDTLAIATVGDIDPSDSSLYHRLAFVGYSMLGGLTKTYPLLLPPYSRKNIKDLLTQICLSNALMLVKGGESDINNSQHFFVPQKDSFSPLIEKAGLIISLLRQRNLKIATMESCTGGAIANVLTDISGSTQVFHSGLIAYDEDVKRMFGVPIKSMVYGGVYSKRVAWEMARAVMNKTGVDIAVATTGTMDTMDKRPFHTDTQPGTVYLAILIKQQDPLTLQLNINLASREQMKADIVNQVFDFLINMLDFQREQEQPLLVKNPRYNLSL